MSLAATQLLYQSLRLRDFDFEFPRELVAAYPAEPRESARLMVVDRAAGTIEHRRVADLPEYFGAGDVLVVNDTMVSPARLRAVKAETGAAIEVFLVRELNAQHRLWDALVDPARKVRVGNRLDFADGLAAEVMDKTTSRTRTLRFITDGAPADLYHRLDILGEAPIPPYLRRPAEAADKVRYQTVFARARGAVAAPTAGLHFTPTLVRAVEARGATVAPVTLHAGLGVFEPVETEDLSKHRVVTEAFAVPEATAACVNAAVDAGARVTACGTTVLRATESALTATRRLKGAQGWTDRFIYPPYEFHVADRLLTNFQRPRSTRLMAVAAFAGMELMRHAYQEAVTHEYRLFSFGDAMLVL